MKYLIDFLFSYLNCYLLRFMCYVVAIWSPEVRVRARTDSRHLLFIACASFDLKSGPPPQFSCHCFFTRKYFYIYCLRKWLDRKKLLISLRTRIGFESEVITKLKVESEHRAIFIYIVSLLCNAR